MASKFLCDCGEQIRTNLFSGNNVKLLVPEEFTDVDENSQDFDLSKFVDKIVIESKSVLFCKNCKRMAIVDNDYNIVMYEPIKNE